MVMSRNVVVAVIVILHRSDLHRSAWGLVLILCIGIQILGSASWPYRLIPIALMPKGRGLMDEHGTIPCMTHRRSVNEVFVEVEGIFGWGLMEVIVPSLGLNSLMGALKGVLNVFPRTVLFFVLIRM